MVGLMLMRMWLLRGVIHRGWVVIKLVIVLRRHHHHHHFAIWACSWCCSRADNGGCGSRDWDTSCIIVHRSHVGLTRHGATHRHAHRHSHRHRNRRRSRSTVRHSHRRVIVIVHGLGHLLLGVVVIALCAIFLLIVHFLGVGLFL